MMLGVSGYSEADALCFAEKVEILKLMEIAVTYSADSDSLLVKEKGGVTI